MGDGLNVEMSECGGMACVLLRDYPLPPGYNKRSSDLLMRLPLSYPNGKPDMFWLEEDLTLAGGAIPQRAGVIETHLGRRWRRFSWHPKSWDPIKCDLRTFIEFINCRLAKGV